MNTESNINKNYSLVAIEMSKQILMFTQNYLFCQPSINHSQILGNNDSEMKAFFPKFRNCMKNIDPVKSVPIKGCCYLIIFPSNVIDGEMERSKTWRGDIKAPYNFSWFIVNKVAACAYPKSVGEVKWLMEQGIKHVLCLDQVSNNEILSINVLSL